MVTSRQAEAPGGPEYDFLIIGAGVCGLYQLYRLRQLGVRVRLLEANDDVGGTWYRNRYPGCRFDSESYSYGYSFSRELLQEWDWTQLFASQPETLTYLNYVADKFDLRRDIEFGRAVTGAEFDDARNQWVVHTEGGGQYVTRFLLTAVGLLSVPTEPRLAGMDTFHGQSFHTFNWPADGIALSGQRVAVVGTGASGVQVISAIADQVRRLTVFQRHPNWCVPLSNHAIGPAAMAEIKASYDEIFARCYQSPSLFIHSPDQRKTLTVPYEERMAFWEQLYRAPGFGLWLGNYKDTLTDPASNEALSQFVAEKIRQRVSNPKVTDALIPDDHGFGTKRVPLETQYYETYNRANVELVDLRQTPITRVTPVGITTTERDFTFDVIVYATGFDAVTGAFDRMDIAGPGGITLRDTWSAGPETYLGVQVPRFPNLFMLMGPQSGSASTNFPRGIEQVVDWTTGLAEFLLRNSYTRVEASAESAERWVSHVRNMSGKALMGQTRSWFTGHNSNIDRDDSPRLMVYTGGSYRYRRWITAEADSDYSGFRFSR
jgi:cation diffusion facilitator CzcD-associated flavoprotein CzcO